MSIRVLIVTLLLLAGCSDREPPEPETQNVRPAKLMTVESSVASERLEFTARIEASQSIDLSFEVGGPLSSIAVREGITVPSGELIAALDPKDFELALSEANVQLKLAAQDLTRKQRVFKQNGIAKSEVEDSLSKYELQQVRVSQARERLLNTKIVAPFEAYVSQRYLDEGVNVQPGQPIVRLHDLNKLLVVMSIPQDLIATVTQEQVISSWAEFAFIADQQFEITYLENRGEADALAQTYEVSFTMDNPEQWNILPGMTANAFIELKAPGDNAILIPASAIVPMPDDTMSVWVFNPESQFVTRRTIMTEAPLASGVPVVRGLKDGEQIVIAGASQLQDGMKVRPLE